MSWYYRWQEDKQLGAHLARIARMRHQWSKDQAGRQRRSRDQWPQFYIRKKHDEPADLSALRLQDRREVEAEKC